MISVESLLLFIYLFIFFFLTMNDSYASCCLHLVIEENETVPMHSVVFDQICYCVPVF